MARSKHTVTVSGPSEKVYIAQFGDSKTWWLITEGDPTDRNWRNWLGGQQLYKRCTQVGENYCSALEADKITKLREVPNAFADWRDEKRPVMVQVAPDDKIAEAEAKVEAANEQADRESVQGVIAAAAASGATAASLLLDDDDDDLPAGALRRRRVAA